MAGKFGANLKGDDVEIRPQKPLFTSDTGGTPSIEELVMEGRRELEAYEGVAEAPHSLSELPLLSELPSSEVKEFLKGRVGDLTVEGTINAMYQIIKNMETQLTDVQDINSALKNDLKCARENESKTVKENDILKNRLQEIEDTWPLREELVLKIRQLTDELNSNQEKIQDLTKEKSGAELEKNNACQEMVKLAEEKNDTLKYASSLETKVGEMVDLIQDYNAQVERLKREIACNENDLLVLEKEKNVLEYELKEAKETFDEIYSELADVKSKTKSYFRELK